jgi:predicted amidohydrolase
MSAPSSVRASVCQFAPGADVEQNRRTVTALVAEAAGSGAHIAVLPEYSNYFVAPLDASIRAYAEPLDGPFVRHLQDLAAEHGLTIVSGLLQKDPDSDRPFNAAVAVDASGVRAVYHKQHLYDAFGNTESDWVTPGAAGAPQTFEVEGTRFGMITCYDLRFPEAMRIVVDAGADVVVVPAEWVHGHLKERHWNTLLSARAIENTVFVVASDHPAPIGVGLSQIVGPDGTTLAATSTTEAVATATLRMADLERVRSINPSLKHRRYRVEPI